MSEIGLNESRELRLEAIRKEAEDKGRVAAVGIRPAGSPLPIASPETGYYKQPMLKEPQWTQLIPLYFFVGGATGSLGVIGSLADVLGKERELALQARWMAIGGSVISGILLVWDLGRPARFLNMLRVFKPQSTMSVGSWVLSGFSLSAGASSFADALEQFFGTNWLVHLIRGGGRTGSVLFGMPFHNYTGVLIGTTVIPVWNERVSSLPREFGMSGLQSAVSLLELTGFNGHPALNALALFSATVEAWEGVDLLRTEERALLPAKRGLSGTLVQVGALLSGPVPIALRIASLFVAKKQLRRIAAVSACVGSLCLRYGWVHAGTVSSRDWRLPMKIEEQPAAAE